MIKYITALLLIIGFALGQSEGIIINLLNGEQIKGDIIEVVPNQYIVVRTATGEQKRINYTHIDYVLRNVGLENVIQAAAEKAVLERLANAMPGISWTFSNAGATGRFGPTQAQVDAAYAGTTLEDKVTIIFTQESERAVAQESAVEAAAWEKQASNEDTVRMADLATKIIKQVKAGEDFGALAAEYSQDPGSQNIGGELGWFEKGRMVKPFEEAAFGAKKGEFVGPVKSRFGYHIIHVKDKKTENGKEQVNAAHILLKFDISAMTLDNLKQASTLFSYDAQDNGFSAAIDSHKVEPIVATSIKEDASFLPNIGSLRSAIRFAFNNPVGSVSTVFETDQHFVVAVTDSAIEAGIAPMVDVEADIIRILSTEKEDAIAKEKAGDILIEATTVGSFTKVLNDQKAYEPITNDSKPLGRGFNSIGRSHSMIGALLVAKPGDLVGPVETPRGYAVVELLQVAEFDSADFAVQKEKIYSDLLTKKQNQFFQSWLGELKRNAEIVDNRKYYF